MGLLTCTEPSSVSVSPRAKHADVTLQLQYSKYQARYIYVEPYVASDICPASHRVKALHLQARCDQSRRSAMVTETAILR